MLSLVGQKLDGRIEIESHLGSGAMGQVYAGRHIALGRRVAVKVVSVDRSRDSRAIARFEREAAAMARFEHPHAVRVFDFGTDAGGRSFLVMELVEGHTLAEELRRHGRLPFARAARILAGVLSALEAAHEHGIVHRDLKPGNIMMVPALGPDFARVLDFGVAKLLPVGERAGTRLTSAGAVVGTPIYMSPEQAAGAEVDPRSDLYSVGIILYELLEGRPPFTAASAVELLEKHIAAEPPALANARVDAVLRRLLAKAPPDRFQSAAEVGAALALLVPTARVRSTTGPSRFWPRGSAFGLDVGIVFAMAAASFSLVTEAHPTWIAIPWIVTAAIGLLARRIGRTDAARNTAVGWAAVPIGAAIALGAGVHASFIVHHVPLIESGSGVAVVGSLTVAAQLAWFTAAYRARIRSGRRPGPLLWLAGVTALPLAYALQFLLWTLGLDV